MAQDPTTSPPRQPQVSHPALQSTPQAKGSTTISEHINTVGVKVDDIRPWITRDVEKFEKCGIDRMLTDLLVDCTNKSQESVKDAYKMRLFQRCLDKVLPICNGTDKTLVDGMKGSHEIKEALGRYSKMKTETELYPEFVTAANTALLFLEELKIEDIRSAEGPAVCLHVNDPMVIRQKHQDHVSERKPDVIVVSEKDVCDKDGEPGDIYTKKERFLNLATKPPSSKKKPFEWRDVRTFIEFKKAKNQMQPPPEQYNSKMYTPPQEEYLTANTLSEPSLDALPEGLLSSGINPRLPPQEPVRRSSRQSKASATINPDSNTRKRNSDHVDHSDSRSKRMKPAQPQPKEQPAIVQAGYYAAEMFTAHTARLHVFGLIVVGDVLYLWRYDRQGNIQCSGFNFIQDLPRFLVLLLAMQRFRERHWGLNPDIDPKFGPGPESHKMALSGDKGEKIDVTIELSDKERVPHYGLNSRATNLFSVKSEKLSNKDDLVAKVFWAEAARMSEPKILEIVNNINDQHVKGHVPVMLWYKSFEDMSTAKIRERLSLKASGARILYIIIFRKLRPITELTGRDFLLAWWQTVKCHLVLWKNKVYHRDISASNLMYYKDQDERTWGVLNDFDLASTQETATGTERTGTIPFMAAALLEDEALEGHVNHAYEHDAESFIWVLTWISLRYDSGKLRELERGRPPALDGWLKVDAAGCREKKRDFLHYFARQSLEAGIGHEESWGLARECLSVLIEEDAIAVRQRVRRLPPTSKHIDSTFQTFLADPVDRCVGGLLA